MILSLLAACSAEKDDSAPPVDTGEVPDVHIPPYAAFVAWVPHGSLNSQCVLTLDLYDAKTVDLPDATPLYTTGFELARGGEWGAVEIAPNLNLVALATASECSQLSDNTPTRSGTFSLDQDEVQLWWYMDSRAGFSTYTEGVDYQPGIARVTLDEGAPSTEFLAFVEGMGLTGEEDPKAPGAFLLTFPEETPVLSVLAGVSTWDRHDHGEPIWHDEPDWW